MSDISTELRSHAVSVFKRIEDEKSKLPQWVGNADTDDPILREALKIAYLQLPSCSQSNIPSRLSVDRTWAPVAPRKNELNAMVIHPHGTFRASLVELIDSISYSALLRMCLCGMPQTEQTFVDAVIECYGQLVSALNGRSISAVTVTGLARVTLSKGFEISTPWGKVRPAPFHNGDTGVVRINECPTSCIFIENWEATVQFDRSASPKFSPNSANLKPSRSRDLLPLACVFASGDGPDFAAPEITWTTTLLPFHRAMSYSLPDRVVNRGDEVNLDGRVADVAKWAKIVDSVHSSSVDIAVKRLVSAISHRFDPGDALIDAVIVWENLFGTSSEVSYRVSAALAKLLECDPMKRKNLRKFLSKIYDVRSRLVHGSSVNEEDVAESCKKAIEYAVKALRKGYNEGQGWLSQKSSDRSDDMLLG